MEAIFDMIFVYFQLLCICVFAYCVFVFFQLLCTCVFVYCAFVYFQLLTRNAKEGKTSPPPGAVLGQKVRCDDF